LQLERVAVDYLVLRTSASHLRAHLIDKMANAHQRGGDVAGWLPLLAQTARCHSKS